MLGVANIYFGNLHRTAPDSYLKELGWARAMYDLALKADAGCAHAANGLGMVSRTLLHVHVLHVDVHNIHRSFCCLGFVNHSDCSCEPIAANLPFLSLSSLFPSCFPLEQ